MSTSVLGRASEKYRKDDSDDSTIEEEYCPPPPSQSSDKTLKIQLLSSLCDTHEKMNEYYQQEKHDRTLQSIRDELTKSSGIDHEEWIELGVFDCLFRMVCEREKISQETTDLIVSIIDLLQLDVGNHFQAFCDAFHDHIYAYDNCTVLLYILHTMLLRHQNSDMYAKLFADVSGINLLMDYYAKKLSTDTKQKYSYARRPMIKSVNSTGLAQHMRSPRRQPKLMTRSYGSLLSLQRRNIKSPVTPRDYSQLYGTSPTTTTDPFVIQSNMQPEKPVNTAPTPEPDKVMKPPFNLKAAIPKLQLPVQPLNVTAPSTRSGRRNMHDGHPSTFIPLENLKWSIDTWKSSQAPSGTKSSENDNPVSIHKRSAFDTISSFAAKLGELYIAGDLTYLIPIKRELDKQTTQKSDQIASPVENLTINTSIPPMKLNIADTPNTPAEEEEPISQPLSTRPLPVDPMSIMHSSLTSDISVKRFFVLSMLNRLTKFPILRKYSRNPVNLFMCEINTGRQPIPQQIKDADMYKKLQVENINIIYDILAQYAEDVEAKYFRLWRQNNQSTLLPNQKKTYDPTRDRALKKFDVFLWRWTGIAEQIIENEDWSELRAQLQSLARYLSSCISRVQASQCTAVCLETLLKIQGLCRRKSRNQTTMQYTFEDRVMVEITHYLLEIFDFVMDSPERHPLLLEFFYFNLVDNEDNFYWMREYAKFLLMPTDSGKFELTMQDMRLRVMKHYQILMNLFLDLGAEFLSKQTSKEQQQQQQMMNGESSYREANLSEETSVMKQFDFLVNPVDGLVLLFLTHGPLEHQYPVKREMLRLLEKIFKLPHLPFLKIESYVNTYIRYHFLNFVQLYINGNNDARTIEACTLHLNVLLAFSINKTPQIVSRFFTMKTVKFLTREINLEFEVNERKKRNMKKGGDDPKQEEFQDNHHSDDTSSHDDYSDDETESDVGTDNLNSPHQDSTPVKDETGYPSDESDIETHRSNRVHLPFVLPTIKGLGGPPEKPVLTLPTIGAPQIPAMKGFSLPGIGNNNPPPPPAATNADSDEDSEDLTSQNDVTDGNISDEEEKPKPVIPTLGKVALPSLPIGGGKQKTPRLISESSGLVMNQAVKGKIPPLGLGAKEEENSARSRSVSIISQTSSDGSIDSPNERPITDAKPTGFAAMLKLPTLGQQQQEPKPTQDAKRKSDSFRSNVLSTRKTGRGVPGINDDISSVASTYRSEADTEIMYESDMSDDEFIRTLYSDQARQTLQHTAYPKKLDISSPLTFAPLEIKEQDEDEYFRQERKNRKLYHDEKLHVSILALLMSLIINNNETLDTDYCDQFPLNKNMMNIPYMLHQHVNDPANEAIIPRLHDVVTSSMGLGCKILLRLLCKKLFEPSLYSVRTERLGVGAFGNVWRCQMRFTHSSVKSVAVKLLKVSASVEGNCVLYTIFNEILIMEKFKADPRICRLYDYGVDEDYYYIVMKEYKCSLKKWRLKQSQSFHHNLPLYMNIYKRLLDGFKFLYDNNVNHFDIKCDNILLDPFDGVTDEEFFDAKTDQPMFELVIGDFGESFVYSNDEEDGYTTRHRGTECIKSPEMLRIEMLKNTSKFYDRRKKVGANSASDVWSLGCLFYELLSGEFLFDSTEFTTFFVLLTDEKRTLISQERFMHIHYNNILMDILTFILVRDPLRRPSIHDILQRFTYQWIKAIPTREQLVRMSGQIETETVVEKIKPKAIQVPEVEPDYSIPLETPHARYPDKEKGEKNRRLSTSLQQGFGRLKNALFKNTAQNNNANNNAKSSTLMPLQPYLWHKSDIAFYIEKASFIVKGRLYVVSDDLAENKSMLNRLGITHIVNCCVSTSSVVTSRVQETSAAADQQFQDNFFYFHMTQHISENSVSAYGEYMRAFEFVRDAIKKRGRVLVYSGKGLSRSGLFIVLYLMNTYNLSSYESYLFVKNRRPALRPEILSHFLHFLLRVQQQQKQKQRLLSELQQHSKEHQKEMETLTTQQPMHTHRKISSIHRKISMMIKIGEEKEEENVRTSVTSLLTGKVNIAKINKDALPAPPPSTGGKKKGNEKNADAGVHWYRCLCGACVVGILSPFFPIRLNSNNITDDKSPMKTWPSFLQEMKLLYFYDAKHINIGFTTKDKVLLDPFDVDKHTEIYVESVAAPSKKNSGRKKSSDRGDSDDDDSDDDDDEEVNWIVRKCKYCSYMMYATKKEKKERPKRVNSAPQAPTIPTLALKKPLNLGGTPGPLTLHLSGIRDKRENERARTFSTGGMQQEPKQNNRSITPNYPVWSNNGLASGNSTPMDFHGDELFKTVVPSEQIDIAVNTSIKTTQIVVSSNVSGIQDLRPQMFFKGCQ